MNATDVEYTIVKSGTTYRWRNNERRGCKFANAPVSFIEYFGLEGGQAYLIYCFRSLHDYFSNRDTSAVGSG